MKIARILSSIKTPAEKTASAAPAAPAAAAMAAPAASDSLRGKLEESIGRVEKVASEAAPAPAPAAATPVGDVMKMAADLEAAEKQAAVAEAEILGRAFMDSAIARYTDWSKTASVQTSTPGVPSAGDLMFGKFASANETLVKQAAEIGYAATRERLEKEAQEEYFRGYNDQMREVRTAAANEFLKAAAVTQQVIERSRQQAAAR